MSGYLQESATESESIQENFPQGPGAHLKKRRESMGLTHVDVANHLNLRVSIIEGIEANNYKHIPKLVFARGYLRSYAKLIGLSGNEIIESFNKLNCPENPSDLPASPLSAGQKKPIKKEHSFVPWIGLVLLILVFVVVGFWKPITNLLMPTTEAIKTQPVKIETTVVAQEKTSDESLTALPDLDQFKQEN